MSEQRKRTAHEVGLCDDLIEEQGKRIVELEAESKSKDYRITELESQLEQLRRY